MPMPGPIELLIILAVVLLLFGGSRLAGLGRSSGRAIREFKEETRSLKDKDADAKKQEKQAEEARGELTTGSEQAARPADPAAEKNPEDLR